MNIQQICLLLTSAENGLFKCFVRSFDIIQAPLCSLPKIKLYLNVTLRRKGCLNSDTHLVLDSDWFRVVLFQIYCSLLVADLPDTTVFSVINNQYGCACVGQNNTQIQSHDKEKTTITDRKVDTTSLTTDVRQHRHTVIMQIQLLVFYPSYTVS